MGVEIVTVGVGPQISMAQLRSMASKPGLTITAPTFESAFTMLPKLRSIVCERKYSWPYCVGIFYCCSYCCVHVFMGSNKGL